MENTIENEIEALAKAMGSVEESLDASNPDLAFSELDGEPFAPNLEEIITQLGPEGLKKALPSLSEDQKELLISVVKSMKSEKLKKKQGVPAGADPATHERCVQDVKAQGHDKSSAYAICNAAGAGMKKSEEDLEKGGPGSGKKPFHEMSRDEYQKEFGKPRKNTTGTGGFDSHKSAVETAINRGIISSHPDYPELSQEVKKSHDTPGPNAKQSTEPQSLYSAQQGDYLFNEEKRPEWTKEDEEIQKEAEKKKQQEIRHQGGIVLEGWQGQEIGEEPKVQAEPKTESTDVKVPAMMKAEDLEKGRGPDKKPRKRRGSGQAEAFQPEASSKPSALEPGPNDHLHDKEGYRKTKEYKDRLESAKKRDSEGFVAPITQSGKLIGHRANHPDHHDWTAQDHEDAMAYHRDMQGPLNHKIQQIEWDKVNGAHTHGMGYDHNAQQEAIARVKDHKREAQAHADAADFMRSKESKMKKSQILPLIQRMQERSLEKSACVAKLAKSLNASEEKVAQIWDVVAKAESEKAKEKKEEKKEESTGKKLAEAVDEMAEGEAEEVMEEHEKEMHSKKEVKKSDSFFYEEESVYEAPTQDVFKSNRFGKNAFMSVDAFIEEAETAKTAVLKKSTFFYEGETSNGASINDLIEKSADMDETLLEQAQSVVKAPKTGEFFVKSFDDSDMDELFAEQDMWRKEEISK